MGSVWKYLISGTLFGFAYEGWSHFYLKKEKLRQVNSHFGKPVEVIFQLDDND